MNNTASQPNYLNWGFVLAQFTCIALCFIGVDVKHVFQLPLWRSLISLATIGLALVNGFWALWAMGSKTFSVLPKPVANGTLCNRGPYRWLAHPMYASVLLICLAAVVIQPTLWRAGVWLLLLVVLVGKLKFEEQLLMQRFADYENYRNARHRLVPGIW